MPVQVTSENLLELLRVSQLLTPKLMEKVRASVPSLGPAGEDSEKLAKSLIKSQLITVYQAQRLLAGARDGFYIGKYKLMEVLGKGGMGVVYLAEQVTMNRLVALKVIGKIAKNRDYTLARFAREARAAAAFSHPNLVQAYDFDEIDGVPFISMEYVEGIDAHRLVAMAGKIEFPQAADLAAQAAAGLEQARLASLVHRDIKPANLLITPQGQLKILDLGLAHTEEDQTSHGLTAAEDQIGTLDYMAPEQARDSRKVDSRADIYSLGCVMYFLVTAQLPFPGRTAAEKLLKHQSADPEPISTVVPEFPAELAAIISKMMEKNPAKRFQTPLEVEEALKPFAKKKNPAYDAGLIKFSKVNLVPLLGKGPDAASLTAQSQISSILEGPVAGEGDTARLMGTETTIGLRVEPSIPGQSISGSSTAASSPTALSPTAARPASSGAGTKPPAGARPSGSGARLAKPAAASTGQPVARAGNSPSGTRRVPQPAIEVVEELPFGSDALSTGPRKGKKSKKKAPSSKASISPMLLAAGFTLAFLAGVGLLWKAVSRPTEPKVLAGFQRWEAYSANLQKDPDLIAYFTFAGHGDTKDVVKSIATNPKFGPMTGQVVGCEKAPGRFPEKLALSFRGKAGTDHIGFGDGDSERFQVNSPLSISMWVQAEKLDAPYATLIARGANSWRLGREGEKDNLEAVVMGPNPVGPDGKPLLDKDGKPQRFYQVARSISSMNDGLWHMVTIVFDTNSSPPRMLVYQDKQMEGSVKVDREYLLTKSPVWIGANSESITWKDPRSWKGKIDEVVVLGRALTADEIGQMYEAGKPVVNKPAGATTAPAKPATPPATPAAPTGTKPATPPAAPAATPAKPAGK